MIETAISGVAIAGEPAELDQTTGRIAKKNLRDLVLDHLRRLPGIFGVHDHLGVGEIRDRVGTDIYWARSRVLEFLNSAAPRLPAGVTRRSQASPPSSMPWAPASARRFRGKADINQQAITAESVEK